MSENVPTEKNIIPCATCRMRGRYEQNPRSLLGRLWRWHTRWCPGWKAYLRSLPADEARALRERLNV